MEKEYNTPETSGRKYVIGVALIVILAVASFFIFNSNTEPEQSITTNRSDTQEQVDTPESVEEVAVEPEPEPEPLPDPQEVEYRIVEERDISYAGCKRIAVSTVVPDDAESRDVEYTLDLLARDYMVDWDDVTVWAWGYSEESQVGSIPATKGTVEETVPGFCN